MDDLFRSMRISASGMRAQGTRLRVISENVANADSLATTPGQEPYRRKLVTFKNELDRNLAITYLVSSRDDMPSHFKGVEKQVRGLLEVLRRLAPDRVDYRVVDPQVSGDAGASYAARRKVSPISVRRVLRDEHDEKKIWSSLVLAAAAAVGIALGFWGGGRIAPALSLSWGIAWVAVARFTDEPYSPATGVAAIVAVALIVIATLFARFRHARRAHADR